MASPAAYLASATNQTYSSAAFGYIGFGPQKNYILEAASRIGVSAAAIAGAMAEENHAYQQSKTKHDLLDTYASSGIDPGVASVSLVAALAAGPLGMTAWLASNAVLLATTRRTHAAWAADYAAVGGTADDPHTELEKIQHPVLVDMGQANIKMATAIRLVNKYAATYSSLQLDKYANDYAQLADDLINSRSDLTAKLAGLMVKEAEDWFTDPNRQAYGADWANLSQVFKDALYVTYFNLGPTALQRLHDEFKAANPGKPYEPQPALGTGGGMNHLLNAQAIGRSIGDAGYGTGLLEFGSGADLAAAARRTDGTGLACRYALRELRYVAPEVIDYAARNQNGALDLFDPQTGQGSLTDEYLADRAAMLTWKVKLLAEGVSAATTAYDKGGAPDAWFKDLASGHTINLGKMVVPDIDKRRFIFGDDGANAVQGGSKNDRLYGGAGNDVLDGFEDGDYLEGGAGNDQLNGGNGDDVLVGGTDVDLLDGGIGFDTYVVGYGLDTITDSDGRGVVKDAAGRMIVGAFLQGTDGRYVWSGDARVSGTLAGTTLTLTLANGQQAVVKDYVQGKLGLSLARTPPPSEYTRTILGDLQPVEPRQHDDLGNLVTTGAAAPDRADDLYGSAGADLIQAKGGDDWVRAKDGADTIEGGGGRDILNGDGGNDLVLGGADADLLFGGAGDDRVFAGDQLPLTAVDGQGGGPGRELLSGGIGDDQLIGAGSADLLLGGDGADLILGGGGDDDLMGDYDAATQGRDWQVRRDVSNNNGVFVYKLYFDNDGFTASPQGESQAQWYGGRAVANDGERRNSA